MNGRVACEFDVNAGMIAAGGYLGGLRTYKGDQRSCMHSCSPVLLRFDMSNWNSPCRLQRDGQMDTKFSLLWFGLYT